MSREKIFNTNGETYTVLATGLKNPNYALLVGGHDYVIIRDLNDFRTYHSWSNGIYFPAFNEEQALNNLKNAINYLNEMEERF